MALSIITMIASVFVALVFFAILIIIYLNFTNLFYGLFMKKKIAQVMTIIESNPDLEKRIITLTKAKLTNPYLLKYALVNLRNQQDKKEQMEVILDDRTKNTNTEQSKRINGKTEESTTQARPIRGSNGGEERGEDNRGASSKDDIQTSSGYERSRPSSFKPDSQPRENSGYFD